jgi:hypothetical protein
MLPETKGRHQRRKKKERRDVSGARFLPFCRTRSATKVKERMEGRRFPVSLFADELDDGDLRT